MKRANKAQIESQVDLTPVRLFLKNNKKIKKSYSVKHHSIRLQASIGVLKQGLVFQLTPLTTQVFIQDTCV